MTARTLFDKAMLIGIADPDDIDLVRRIRTGTIMSCMGIVILIPMSIIAFYEEHFLLASMDLLSAALLTANLVVLAIKKNFDIFSSIAIGFMTAFFIYLFVTGGSSLTGHLWSYTLPLFSVFVVGARRGAVAVIAFLISAITTLIARPPWLPDFAFDPTFYVRFILSFALTSVFAYSLETWRQRATEKLHSTIENLSSTERALTETNEDLRKEVEYRRNAEERLLLAKKEADTANRFKSEFLANMSHELRTPLNHIIGFSELLTAQQLGELNEKQLEFLRDISDSSNHLLSLINDILDLSKIEAGKMGLTLSRVDLAGAVDSGMNMVRERANKHGIELKVDTDDQLNHFVADERKVRQVLYNLLSNAVKFTPDGGTVTVTSRRAVGGAVHIAVSDTGIGIGSDDIDRIFDSFEQIEGDSIRRFEGTGLGLSLSKKIVELHGGEIHAESPGEGKGSTFTFSIPPLTIPGLSEVTA